MHIHSRQKPINRRVSERPITHFNDPLELLYAFRDAVANHREHWKRGQITDGVSPSTILIQSSVSFGTQGMLQPRKLTSVGIDDRNVTARKTDLQFSSISVSLRDCYGPISIPAHDYRDDLESFYYVLKWICATQFGHGTAQPLAPGLSTRGRTPLETASLKYRSLHIDGPMTEIFGGGVWNLLTSLREFCLDNYHYRFNDVPPGELSIDPSMSYSVCGSVNYDMAEYDYRAYLALIEQAIAEEKRSWPARRAWLMAQL